MLKKLAINIVITLLIVFILDFAIGNVLRYFYFKESSGLHYRTTYSVDSTTANLLIVGSSRANHHYVPEVFEDSLKETFYNTGRDGNGTFYQFALVKSVLKRYQPKIIIFEYSSKFENEPLEYDQMSSLLPYYKDHSEIRKIIELRSPMEKLKLLSQIYPFNSQILTIGVGNLEINKARVTDNKGYVPLYDIWHENLDSIADRRVFAIDTNKINAFKECLTLPKKLGVQVYVVFSPLFQKYHKNQELDRCSQICAAQNIPFWDYSKDSSFLSDKTLFKDILHLNYKGAAKFSKLIAGKIKQYQQQHLGSN